MKNISIFICVSMLCTVIDVSCFGQRIVVGARDELAVNIGVNLPLGAKSINGAPTLLANMNPGYSVDLRYATSIVKRLQIGAWVGGSKFAGWSSSVSPQLFSGTSMSFLSIGPVLGYKTSPAGTTGNNKLSFGAWLLPGVSRINIVTDEDAQINDDTNPNTLTVQSTRLTVGLNAGLSYICNTSFGVSVSAGYRYTTAESKVFKDNSYSFVHVGVGIFYRIHLDKRFKYSHL